MCGHLDKLGEAHLGMFAPLLRRGLALSPPPPRPPPPPPPPPPATPKPPPPPEAGGDTGAGGMHVTTWSCPEGGPAGPPR